MIIGLSGKKQAGKDTICRFLMGEYLIHKDIISTYTLDTENDQLVLPEEAAELESIPVYIYPIAAQLKNICVNFFGIPEEQITGSDDDKNKPTHIKWEEMPLYSNEDITKVGKRFQNWDSVKKYTSKSGYMTGREFMQVFGSDICRKIYAPVWIHSCLNQIKSDNVEVALIPDCRFPNEVETIEANGGHVIRLTRNPLEDTHFSENILNDYNFKHVIDNKDMDIPTQNAKAYELLKDILFV